MPRPPVIESGQRAAWAGIERACGPDGPPDLIGELHRRLRMLVPHEAAFLAATDPLTGLSTSPAVVDNIGEEYCSVFWEQEFGEDLLPFAELTRGPLRAGGLRAGAGARVRHSGRFRHMMRPSGLGDEARVVFMDGGTVWGVAALYREEGRAPFGERELSALEKLAPIAGRGLRARALDQPADSHGIPVGPGLVVLDPELRVLSMNDDAEAWLRLLPADPHSAGRPLPRPRPGLMTEVITVARRAAARVRAEPGDGAPGGHTRARLRVRATTGLWLTIHASRLNDGSEAGSVAVVIEAAKASEMAPIIAEALGLTARE
ncbi:MAG: hypothetical protein RJQ03_11145, partial [Miltoncostaeaceae bacterium]